MALAQVSAGGIGIQAFDTVNQPVLDQEIQCPVDRRGLRAQSVRGQHMEYVVGPQCAMLLQQNLEDATPNRSELELPLRALCLGRAQGAIDAARVIMAVNPIVVIVPGPLADTSRVVML